MDDKKLVRRPDKGMIAGVAAGVADRYGIEVTLVRIAFVGLAIITSGIPVVILYLIAAVIMPRADDEQLGTDSVKHGVDDLVSRGKELYGETRKIVDRTTSRGNSGSVETPTEEPATVAPTPPSGQSNQ